MKRGRQRLLQLSGEREPVHRRRLPLHESPWRYERYLSSGVGWRGLRAVDTRHSLCVRRVATRERRATHVRRRHADGAGVDRLLRLRRHVHAMDRQSRAAPSLLIGAAATRGLARDENFIFRSGSRWIVSLRSNARRAMPVAIHASGSLSHGTITRSARTPRVPGLFSYV